ncbi:MULTISPECIES: calcium-binding protein [unclassified Sphingomonas]|uniref:calcium-binding protein n=1 Tax=unclassified Sphingomonas TaxID=196159 RepID=UPI0006FB1A54|nr:MULTISPECIES: calcium-binding protein [unclassified Sphingomonas]KQX21595.1 hypothetical protein ASD17_06485 [Sphingomonas sp. Root1294]KQY72912.1 hypothetical protein ASD39_00470 [Sphingomonas sp. Root50]KRB88295.1 hypothetical protein ASE22_22970 [Sphingomonas sp. Root720]
MVMVTPVGDAPVYMGSLFDFVAVKPRPEAIHVQTTTSWIFDDQVGRSSYSGIGFTYDAQGLLVSGTITGLHWSAPVYGAFDVGGLAISAAAFRQSWAGGDPLAALLPGDDVYQGSSHDDIIRDVAGHNVFLGGDGFDQMSGGPGNDHLWGQSPNGGPDEGDYLAGGGGSDYIQGNAGDDLVEGGDGSDRLYGGQGEDALYGGPGNDTINGNLGNDYIQGNEGNDLLRGGQGDDGWISGGEGNDTIMGDLGADRMFGGWDADLFVFGPGTSPIGATIDSVADFEQGSDLISLGFVPATVLTGSSAAAAASIDAARTAAQALFDGHAGDHEVAAIGYQGATLIFWSGNGGAAIDSVVSFQNQSPTDFALADFG